MALSFHSARVLSEKGQNVATFSDTLLASLPAMFANFRFSKSILQKSVLSRIIISPKMAEHSTSSGFEPKIFTALGQSLSEEDFDLKLSEFVKKINSSGTKGVLFIGENHQVPTFCTYGGGDPNSGLVQYFNGF